MHLAITLSSGLMIFSECFVDFMVNYVSWCCYTLGHRLRFLSLRVCVCAQQSIRSV